MMTLEKRLASIQEEERDRQLRKEQKEALEVKRTAWINNQPMPIKLRKAFQRALVILEEAHYYFTRNTVENALRLRKIVNDDSVTMDAMGQIKYALANIGWSPFIEYLGGYHYPESNPYVTDIIPLYKKHLDKDTPLYQVLVDKNWTGIEGLE